jgi:hypothetical protein
VSKVRHTIGRLEQLLPACENVVEEILKGLKDVICPVCSHTFQIKIPDHLALKAAFGTMDRAGVGPVSKHQELPSAPMSSSQELEGLIPAFLLLPLEDRVVFAQAILPEYTEKLLAQPSMPSGSDPPSPVDASCSQTNSSEPTMPRERSNSDAP